MGQIVTESSHEEGRAIALEQGRREGLTQRFNEGFSQGLTEGKRQTTLSTAKSLCMEGLDPSIIARATKLPINIVKPIWYKNRPK